MFEWWREWMLITLNTLLLLSYPGVWCLLFVPMVWTQFKRRSWTASSLLWHGRNVSVFTLSRTCQISVGRNRGWYGLGPCIWAIYGCWLQDDYYRRRVSVLRRRINWVNHNHYVFYREGQAIWMDENIRFGKTDRCQTFNNPPLCASGDFEIRVLEVYGFVGAWITCWIMYR